MDGALDWATVIHDQLAKADVNAWIWWVLFLWHNDEEIMSSWSGVGPENCATPVECREPSDCPSGYTCAGDPETDRLCRQGLYNGRDYSISKTFWALGNFSKFIRPGFVRIGAASNAPSLLASAYKDPATGRLVVVAINNSDRAHHVKFNAAGFRFPSGLVKKYVTSATENLVPHVADFAQPVWIPARSIVTLAPSQPEIVWRKPDGSVHLWLMSGGAVQSQLWTGTPDTNWTIQGVGDFDADGISDLYWRCTGPSCHETAHGQLAVWYRGQQTNPGASYPGLMSDDGWQIKGVGDFDRSGKSDLLWQYSGPGTDHGQLEIWHAGQSTSPPPSRPAVVGDDGWQIQGIGDFNGDRYSDVLWRYFGADNHGQLAIWWRGQKASPTPAFPTAVPDDGWRIKGVGDFDGDGKSDVLWQYAGRVNHGQLAVWWNGQYLDPPAWYPGRVVDDHWVIKGIEDFDGDKRSDVLWQFDGPFEPPRGRLAIWFGAQATDPPPAHPAVAVDNLLFQATGKSGL